MLVSVTPPPPFFSNTRLPTLVQPQTLSLAAPTNEVLDEAVLEVVPRQPSGPTADWTPAGTGPLVLPANTTYFKCAVGPVVQEYQEGLPPGGTSVLVAAVVLGVPTHVVASVGIHVGAILWAPHAAAGYLEVVDNVTSVRGRRTSVTTTLARCDGEGPLPAPSPWPDQASPLRGQGVTPCVGGNGAPGLYLFPNDTLSPPPLHGAVTAGVMAVGRASAGGALGRVTSLKASSDPALVYVTLALVQDWLGTPVVVGPSQPAPLPTATATATRGFWAGEAAPIGAPAPAVPPPATPSARLVTSGALHSVQLSLHTRATPVDLFFTRAGVSLRVDALSRAEVIGLGSMGPGLADAVPGNGTTVNLTLAMGPRPVARFVYSLGPLQFFGVVGVGGGATGPRPAHSPAASGGPCLGIEATTRTRASVRVVERVELDAGHPHLEPQPSGGTHDSAAQPVPLGCSSAGAVPDPSPGLTAWVDVTLSLGVLPLVVTTTFTFGGGGAPAAGTGSAQRLGGSSPVEGAAMAIAAVQLVLDQALTRYREGGVVFWPSVQPPGVDGALAVPGSPPVLHSDAANLVHGRVSPRGLLQVRGYCC
jgi:hypothetical protein